MSVVKDEKLLKLSFQPTWNPGETNYLGQGSILEKLGEGFYCANNYGYGNAGFVITGEGVAVIDATVSTDAARAVLAEIRKLTDQPIKYLIYTHGHGDHVLGGAVFRDAGAVVIGHRNVVERFNRYNKMKQQFIRINGLQFQRNITDGEIEFNVYPDITYDREYTFEMGGKTFRLFHGKGETDDHTVVYIPEDGVIFVGDMITGVFPNIGNPQKVIRYEREWYETLERILSLGPRVVCPGHGRSLIDKESIVNCLEDTAAVLKFLHEECVKYINRGSSLEEALAGIQLPEKLANSPYLRPVYGCREFTIRGIYRRYTGWFDGNPTSLSPSPAKEVSQAILELIGSRGKIVSKVKSLRSGGGLQLALHLIDIVLSAHPEDREMHALKGDILEQLAMASENLFYRNFYLGFVHREREMSK